MSEKINLIDLSIIIIYLVGILVIGIMSVRLKKMTSDRYFLAGRGLNWILVGAALFASNISTIHLVGLAASGYNEGLVWGNFEWLASITLIMLGLIFAPFYFKSKISTLPEFLEKRYDSRSRTVMAFIAIIGALFVHIGMSLYAGAVVFETFFGNNVLTSILVISIVTTIYTVLGGLKAVVVTETIQTVILILGAIMLTGFAIFAFSDFGVNTLADFKANLKPGQLNMLHTQKSLEALGGVTKLAVAGSEKKWIIPVITFLSPACPEPEEPLSLKTSSRILHKRKTVLMTGYMFTISGIVMNPRLWVFRQERASDSRVTCRS